MSLSSLWRSDSHGHPHQRLDPGGIADAPAALQPVIDLSPKDQMLFQCKQAARYSASLAQNPDRFCALLQR